MRGAPALTDELRVGRRALDGVAGVELLAEVLWAPQEQCWVLPLRLRADTSGSSIPEWTDWYVLIDEHYPWGRIDILPSKKGSIEDTHPHQRLNRPGSAARPWREGRLCLQTGLASLGLRARPEEPRSAETRLSWHVASAREWLETAARGQLLAPGHAFELPDLPTGGNPQVVFRETAQSLGTWTASTEPRGWVELSPVPGNSRLLAVKAFSSLDGRRVFSPEWGDLLRAGPRRNRIRVPWMRCDSLPVLQPYAPPTTWPELEEVLRSQRLDLRKELQAFASRLRDGKRHLCLIGFPIPEKVGQPDLRMHWWALRLPMFAHGNVAPRGYRRNERAYWLHDQTQLFKHSLPLNWLRTDNWAPEDLRSRGAMPEPLRNSWVLLLGAGALGSAMAELLVRGGISRLVIMDGEVLEAGNLVRHTLDVMDVRCSKAHALARRLRNLNPDLQVHAIPEPLDEQTARSNWLVSRCETILDCTASDEVLEVLGRHTWDRPHLFFSASFGVGARRLLCFSATGSSFPSGEFWKRAGAWIQQENEELRRTSLPREGLGCWHPVFPARADDVALAAAIAVKALVRATATRPDARLDVYEREEHEDSFRGVTHVSPVEAHASP
ncbi:HesA/MoeB/ThiF family protein [Archangium lansingense]|uniref:ThiF family adenylyltransferase n=1 Tax=Archangium lansingense TaxID=2995310 RepID=A0ABT3ZXU3_9BACT|nr:ThiF family adenylyltransferase [Archangium lansinium]MCY1074220.1 ThiF family adenylyltransferase [Archangium lansinium]